MPTTLLEQTEKTRQALISALPADQQDTVGRAFAELMASSAAAGARQVGHQAVDFQLPNVKGGALSLRTALSEGPVVLSFYRGSWCPFCSLELNALQARLPEIIARGARLVAISPEKPDSSLSHTKKLQLEFDVLTDAGNHTARGYGLIMTVHEALRPLYLQWGVDLPTTNGDASYELPVPATYVIAANGEIRAAYVDKDYTKRMEPDAIIAALDAL